LVGVNLSVRPGEILALLGPNGAGKTTLIASICGLSKPTSGSIQVGGYDINDNYLAARKLIGLVPQEISLEPFETVKNTLMFSRGLFGLPPDRAYIDQVLKQLSLWDKRRAQIKSLSGGMRRRVMIAKALVHEPRILFLDEPTAGVDVELRHDMWMLLKQLKADGVTIILTTHYIDEAEAIADRIAIINHGKILLVEEKATLMQRLGQKTLTIELTEPLQSLPNSLAGYRLALVDNGNALKYDYGASGERTGITSLLADLSNAGLVLRDLQTEQSSLETIFITLLEDADQ
ncbi:MAG: ABC transporter ATP-binding protein, partial [Paracoccaceae bacterium]|nr:ABC transporter ATP-binding protein [Paracoccaceae bacterium]